MVSLIFIFPFLSGEFTVLFFIDFMDHVTLGTSILTHFLCHMQTSVSTETQYLARQPLQCGLSAGSYRQGVLEEFCHQHHLWLSRCPTSSQSHLVSHREIQFHLRKWSCQYGGHKFSKINNIQEKGVLIGCN